MSLYDHHGRRSSPRHTADRDEIAPLFVHVYDVGKHERVGIVSWKDWEHEKSKWEGQEVHLVMIGRSFPPPVSDADKRMTVPCKQTTRKAIKTVIQTDLYELEEELEEEDVDDECSLTDEQIEFISKYATPFTLPFKLF